MAKKQEKQQSVKPIRYFEGVGRRKTAVARVRITKGTGNFLINSEVSGEYFNTGFSSAVASSPLDKLALSEKFDVSAKVSGGGMNAQAEAVRLGLARALVMFDSGLKNKLRAFGFLTRDPRMVERKKYGLKKARRAPQWQKR